MMNKTISQSEKLDVFLALATTFKEQQKDSNSSLNSFSQALNGNDRQLFQQKLNKFNSLDEKKKQVWQTFWLEKIKQRSKTLRLDETIHPEQIAEVLKHEPFLVQVLIQEKLPDILADKVATVLQNQPLLSVVKKKAHHKKVELPKPNKKVLSLIRQIFLDNFVAFEDLYKPLDIDRLDTKKLGNFIWKIGIREIAIFCRGIKTKEDLANFLKDFEEEQTKEILLKISNLRDIQVARVTKTESLINEIFLLENEPSNRIRCLGLRLISISFINRDKNAQQYTIQKLPIEIGNILRANILTSTNEYNELKSDRKRIYEEFGNEILLLATEFLEDI